MKLALARVPAAERPAKAAEIVKLATTRDRTAITIEVVRDALAPNPAAASAVVGAIAKAVPEMAPVAAGAAAQLQPGLVAEIAKTAVAAAPDQVEKIVTAVCRVVPKDYRSIALAAADVLPGSVKEILRGVVAAVPDLKPIIENALSIYQGNPPSVTVVLDTTGRQANESSGAILGPVVRGPTLAPPYIPPSQTSTNVTPSTSGTVPRGGRNYSAP